MDLFNQIFESGIGFVGSIAGKIIATLIPFYFLKKIVEEYENSGLTFLEKILNISLLILIILYLFKIKFTYFLLLPILLSLQISYSVNFYKSLEINKSNNSILFTFLYFLSHTFLYLQSTIIAGGYIAKPSLYYIFLILLFFPYSIYFLIIKNLKTLTSTLYKLFIFSVYLYFCTIIGLTKQ